MASIKLTIVMNKYETASCGLVFALVGDLFGVHLVKQVLELP